MRSRQFCDQHDRNKPVARTPIRGSRSFVPRSEAPMARTRGSERAPLHGIAPAQVPSAEIAVT
jgi:hypothetical protein